MKGNAQDEAVTASKSRGETPALGAGSAEFDPRARHTYDEIKNLIENAPVTWVPGLLRAAVERAITAKVFVANGLERYVAKIIERMQ